VCGDRLQTIDESAQAMNAIRQTVPVGTDEERSSASSAPTKSSAGAKISG